MKKIYALFLAVIMMFTLTACNSANESSLVSTPSLISTGESLTNSNDNSARDSTDNAPQTSSSDISSSKSSFETRSSASKNGASEQSSSTQQSPSVSSSSPVAQSSSNPQSSSAESSSSTVQPSLPSQSRPEPDTAKILVAYFSATNTTEGVANTIADCLDSDLYKITPAVPYTSADLNYNDDNSRSTHEMNDPNSRPQISGAVDNMEQYDIVFIGYPIWWGDAPRILSTFVESYDFSEKTIVPFCTSGGSGVGSSARNLEKLTSGATWLAGTRHNRNASKDTIIKWINGLGLNITAE